MFFLIFKRLIDFILSVILLILLLPILLFVILISLICNLQNPFFIQERSGLNGKLINVYKLKTMRDYKGKKIITKFGSFLRISKLDEIPQLINVIVNDMSLIGPRPLYVEFNDHYKKKHKLRLKMKPGITGLAQIKLKDSSNWHMKFNFDYIYYKNKSISLDMFILYKTFTNILFSLFDKNRRPIEKIDYLEDFFKKYAK